MTPATAPRDLWEHARRLLPGRVLRVGFATESAARAFRLRLYRVRSAERVESYADPDASLWGISPWDALEITLARPQMERETWELHIARRASGEQGPIEVSVGKE